MNRRGLDCLQVDKDQKGLRLVRSMKLVQLFNIIKFSKRWIIMSFENISLFKGKRRMRICRGNEDSQVNVNSFKAQRRVCYGPAIGKVTN